MGKIGKLLFCIYLLSLPAFSYIVKIGNEEISKKSFQEYVDVQKFIDSIETFDDLVKKKKTTRNDILTDYINLLILVREAKKKGYTEKKGSVVKAYEDKKKAWVNTLYIAKNIDIDSITVTESDMQKIYNEIPSQARTKSYSQLGDQEKQPLYEMSLIKAAQEKKKKFQKILEKQYKTKRFGINKEVVAEVDKKKITKKILEEKISEQISKLADKLGVTEKEIADRDPKRFEQAKNDILDELIFEELVALDIKASGFVNNKLISRAYGFLMDKVISEQFILYEVAPKHQITSKELDEAFIQVSRQNQSIKNMLPTEQEKLLKTYIIQSKIPDIIKNYVEELKEGMLIKRNKNELDSIS